MLNQVILVGKIKEVVSKEYEGATSTKLFIICERKDKPELMPDVVAVSMNSELAKMTTDICKVGNMIGVKAHIEVVYDQIGYVISVVADNIAFLQADKKVSEV